MKPRNKHERRAEELSNLLPNITRAQQKYAFEHCFPHLVVYRSGMYHCTDCGHSWHVDKKEHAIDNEFGVVRCPNCGHELKLHTTRKQSWFERSSFQIVTTVEESQVIRTFYTRKYYTVDKPAHYWIDEAVRIMMFPQRNDDVIIARPINYNGGYYCDCYSFCRPLSIKCIVRHMNRDSSYNIHPYLATADVVYPRRRVLPILKRNGYGKSVYDLSTYYIIRALLDNPRIETIVKAGRTDILHDLDTAEIDRLWAQVKMLIRHGYHPADFTLWKDTIKMASDLHLDIHSPKYILPADLTTLHDQLARRITARIERERKEKVNNGDAWYRKQHGLLLSVVIEEAGMHIVPLQTKEEFVEEGRRMHHCVASYFDKTDSLILSVRSDEGKRMATVELNKRDFSIVQCRANCNKQPKRYSDILSVINSHRAEFVQVANPKHH
ncbi:MAG: PcfJ domain-containing protein [Bacteroidales bacterium]|nr:PcfJ domain-containing protein [Bacteroidales bacterium]